MHGTLDFAQVPVRAYMDLTAEDLIYINRRASRIARALGNRYSQFGPHRQVTRQYAIPKDRIDRGVTPTLTLNFERTPPGAHAPITEATVSIDFTIAPVFSDLKRKLVTTISIDAEHAGREIVLNPVGTSSTVSRMIFHLLSEERLLQHPFYDQEAASPNMSRARREDERSERFLSLATVKLRESFMKHFRAPFERVDFEILPHHGKFRMAFWPRPDYACARRYTELKGKVDALWEKNEPHALAVYFEITDGLLTKDFNDASANPGPFNILNRPEAAEKIFYALLDARHVSKFSENLVLVTPAHVRGRTHALRDQRRARRRENRRELAGELLLNLA